jgi:hypothetical protein
MPKHTMFIGTAVVRHVRTGTTISRKQHTRLRRAWRQSRRRMSIGIMMPSPSCGARELSGCSLISLGWRPCLGEARLNSGRRRALRPLRIRWVRAHNRHRGSCREKHRYYSFRTTIRAHTPAPGNGGTRSMEVRFREQPRNESSCKPKEMTQSYRPVSVCHYV